MSDKDTGGHAFPKTPFVEIGTPQNGMTLRDYFAAKAMEGLIPQFREMFIDGTFECWVSDAIPTLADESYYMADAMLKARNK
jgi:hypothetical protein